MCGVCVLAVLAQRRAGGRLGHSTRQAAPMPSKKAPASSPPPAAKAPSPASAPRLRGPHSGTDVRALAEIFAKHIEGPDDIDYGESMTADQDSDRIVPWKRMLKEVRDRLHPSTTLTQKMAVQIFKEVAVMKHDEFEADGNDNPWLLMDTLESWVDGVSKKVRAMLRHIEQTLVKSRFRLSNFRFPQCAVTTLPI